MQLDIETKVENYFVVFIDNDNNIQPPKRDKSMALPMRQRWQQQQGHYQTPSHDKS